MSEKSGCRCEGAVRVPVQGLQLVMKKNCFSGGDCGCSSGGNPGRGIRYSFEEQWTGEYWVDGRKIYQKTIDCGAMPVAATSNTPHGIENIDATLDMSAFAVNPNNKNTYVIPCGGDAERQVALYKTDHAVHIVTISNVFAPHRAYVTMRYTCTDR